MEKNVLDGCLWGGRSRPKEQHIQRLCLLSFPNSTLAPFFSLRDPWQPQTFGIDKVAELPLCWTGHPRVRAYSPGMKGFQEGGPPPLHQKRLMGPHCREDSLLNHLHLACFFSYLFCSFSCLEEHVFFHAHLLKLTVLQLAWTSRLSQSPLSNCVHHRANAWRGMGVNMEVTPQQAQRLFLQNLSSLPGPLPKIKVPPSPSLLTNKGDFSLALYPLLTELGISWLMSKSFRDPGSFKPDLWVYVGWRGRNCGFGGPQLALRLTKT